MSFIVVIPFSKAHSYAAICSSLYLVFAASEIVGSVVQVVASAVAHVVVSAVAHVVASAVSQVVTSAAAHVVASAVVQVVVSAVAHVVASAVVQVVASAVAQVVVSAVAQVVASASLVSSASTKEIDHNKNAPNRRKENFFIFLKIKYKTKNSLITRNQRSIKYRLKAYCPISNLTTNRLLLCII
jgi:hypothetical protein